MKFAIQVSGSVCWCSMLSEQVVLICGRKAFETLFPQRAHDILWNWSLSDRKHIAELD